MSCCNAPECDTARCCEYRWIEDWITIPASASAQENGRTHGVVVSRSGNIHLFHQASPSVLEFTPQGELVSSWGDYPGAHGMTLVEEDGVEFLWLVDQYSCAVHKTTLDGKVVQSLERPDHPAYANATYMPTWVAVWEERIGGNGDIWLSDGYGTYVVHRFDKHGRYLGSIDGTEGEAGKFSCPHGIWIGNRHGGPKLYIADRANARIQVYDMEGHFIRSFGSDFLTSPNGFFEKNGHLIVPERCARVTLLDENDNLLRILGENDSVTENQGWPDNRENLLHERFNSPHLAAADADGNIYVVEWITGGRVIKLEPIKN